MKTESWRSLASRGFPGWILVWGWVTVASVVTAVYGCVITGLSPTNVVVWAVPFGVVVIALLLGAFASFAYEATTGTSTRDCAGVIEDTFSLDPNITNSMFARCLGDTTKIRGRWPVPLPAWSSSESRRLVDAVERQSWVLGCALPLMPRALLRPAVLPTNEAHLTDPDRVTLSVWIARLRSQDGRHLRPQDGALLSKVHDAVRQSCEAENLGTLVRFSADGWTVVWNQPRRVDDHAYLAVAAACECTVRLSTLDVRVSGAVHTCDAFFGVVGSVPQVWLSLWGDEVDMASALASGAGNDSILCSSETIKAVCAQSAHVWFAMYQAASSVDPTGRCWVLLPARHGTPELEAALCVAAERTLGFTPVATVVL